MVPDLRFFCAMFTGSRFTDFPSAAATLSVEPRSASSSLSASNLRSNGMPQVSVTPLSYSPVLSLPPVDVPSVRPPPSFPMEAPPSYETVMLDDMRR